eukprot:15325050-Ditylum_brightwellii.AAC.1
MKQSSTKGKYVSSVKEPIYVPNSSNNGITMNSHKWRDNTTTNAALSPLVMFKKGRNDYLNHALNRMDLDGEIMLTPTFTKDDTVLI